MIKKITLERTGKITLVTAVILLLTIGMLVTTIQLQPTVAGKKPAPTPPTTWSLRLPGGYSSARSMFMNGIPELTASKFHYSNPNFAGSTPSVSVNINLESVSAKATDYVFYENWHLTASGVDCSVGVPILGATRIARIMCKSLTADVNLYPPHVDGEFGKITATLKGDVLLSVPVIPDSPMTGYYYIGQELAIAFTLVEPRYTVTADPEGLSIPQGCEGITTVTVTPLETGITGGVGVDFKCGMGGINGWFEGGGTPPASWKLHIFVQPGVPAGPYTAYVVVNDWTTGEQYLGEITITVTPSGYDITVNDANPADLGQILLGEGKEWKIAITPTTPYSDGVDGFKWNPTSGDFNGIGIGMPGIDHFPPWEGKMSINVSPQGVSSGTREMDILVFDGNLKREFTCHVTFEVVIP